MGRSRFFPAFLLLLLTSPADAHDFRGLRRMVRHTDSTEQARKDLDFTLLRQMIASKSHAEIEGVARTEAKIQAVVVKQDVWPGGKVIDLCFYPERRFKWFEGARLIVMRTFAEILQHTTLSVRDTGLCQETTGDIRIRFHNFDGDWSEVGQVGAKKAKSDEPTMGLDTLASDGPTADALGLVRHEILHSLGFQHEHQSPEVRCQFVRARKLAHLLKWTLADVRENFTRIDPASLCKDLPGQCLFATPFDKKSIMLYSLTASYFRHGKLSPCYVKDQNNLLSELDIKTLKLLYPLNGPQLK